MEDVDLEAKLGLESKLVNLIERLDIRETGFNQKVSNVTPSGITEGLGNLSLSDIPPIPEMEKQPCNSRYTPDQKNWDSISWASDPCPPEPLDFPSVSRKPPHKCEACEKLGYYWGPPLLVCTPTCVDFENDS